MNEVAYSYVTLRYVHDMTTREFVNVGVVVFSPQAKYVGAKVSATFPRVVSMFPGVKRENLAALLSHIQAQVEILNSQVATDSRTGSSSKIESLVHSILPKDESSLQWGDVGGGIATDVRATLTALHQRLVSKYERPAVQRTVIQAPVVVTVTQERYRARIDWARFAMHGSSRLITVGDPHTFPRPSGGEVSG